MEAEAAVRQADRMLAEGRSSEALAEYRRAADLFRANGFYAKAAAVVRRTLRLGADEDDGLRRLAELSALLELPGEARASYQKLLERARDRADAALEMACLIGLGRLADADLEARAAAFRAAAAGGATKQALLILDETIAAHAEADPSGVRRFVSGAAALSPLAPELLVALARAAVGGGDDPRPFLMPLLTTTPERHRDVEALAEEWRDAGREDLSFASLDLVVDVAVLGDDVPRALATLESFLLRGEHAEARARYEALLAVAPPPATPAAPVAEAPVAARTERVPARPVSPRRTPRVPRPTASVTRPPDLQTVFDTLRSQAEAAVDAQRAAEHLRRGLEFVLEGRPAEARGELEAAARDPLTRFAAAAQLGRLEFDAGHLTRAIEWLEQAGQAPPPSPDEGWAVTYELASLLEMAEEPERALAVLLELDTDAPGFRDVATRIAGLRRIVEGDVS